MSEMTLQRLSREAESDPRSNAAFEIWFMQQGFPGGDKMAAGYAWGEARKRALEWAAGQVEAEIDEAADERRGGVSEGTYKLRRLAAKIREGAP